MLSERRGLASQKAFLLETLPTFLFKLAMIIFYELCHVNTFFLEVLSTVILIHIGLCVALRRYLKYTYKPSIFNYIVLIISITIVKKVDIEHSKVRNLIPIFISTLAIALNLLLTLNSIYHFNIKLFKKLKL